MTNRERKLIEKMVLGKPMLDVLNGHKLDKVPFWLMRQAGRYLPEYRALRATKKNFMELAMDPIAACEVTMQPIRRFGMDGAIIFSDILVIPHALGQKVEFVEGEGPKLEPMRSYAEFSKLNFNAFDAKLAPVYETLTRVKTELNSKGFQSTTLIGFSGAPWTLAAYMIEGGGSKDFAHAKLLAYKDPKGFSYLIEFLVESISNYLIKQIDAGAEVVQLFDSWSGLLEAHEFAKWVIRPTHDIVKKIRQIKPHTPIIGFPRGAGQNYLSYAHETGVTAIAFDQQTPTKWAARALQNQMPVQGNLDPMCLLAGGDALTLNIERILGDLNQGGLIFNLGHGVDKNTPIEHVEKLATTIKNHRRT